MKGIPFKQMDWGTTIKLGFVRAWSSGFVFMILMYVLHLIVGDESSLEGYEPLIMWIFYPVVLPFMGLLFAFLSLFPMGRGAAQFIGILLFCWGDPILYILRRTTGIFSDIDLKFFNFVAIIYVLKGDEVKEE